MTRERGVATITIYDVARACGVSIKTVSRVMNGEPNVRPQTRQRVLDSVNALSYRPNLSARSLAGARSYLLGMLFDNPSPAYVSDLQQGLSTRCRQDGYHLVVEPVDCEAPDVAEVVEAMIGALKMDGLVLTPPVSDAAAVLDALDRLGVAYVRIAPGADPHRAARVEIDDRRAAHDMTLQLLGSGHRHIGFIKGHPAHGASQMRYQGYVQALGSYEVKIRSDWVAQGYFSFESGVACAHALLGREDRPTAIFASNDDMALAVMMVASRLGLKIPDDLSVAGFDDTPSAKMVWPALSTVRQPIADMAYAAADLILSRLSREEDGAPAVRRLDFSLILRDSIAAPRSLGSIG
jgi:LacI family transcriptional regulator